MNVGIKFLYVLVITEPQGVILPPPTRLDVCADAPLCLIWGAKFLMDASHLLVKPRCLPAWLLGAVFAELSQETMEEQLDAYNYSVSWDGAGVPGYQLQSGMV